MGRRQGDRRESKPKAPLNHQPTPGPNDDVDATITRLVHEGREAEALGLLMSTYGGRIARFIRRRVGDVQQAEDLTQETFVRAMHGLSGFRGDAKVLTWLTRIAYNVVYTSTSRGKRRRDLGEDYRAYKEVDTDRVAGEATTGSQRPDEDVRRREVARAIDACLGRMNDVVRELALLVWVEGCSFVEAAEITGMKEDAVRKRLVRARPVLQRCLELRGVVGCT